MSVTFQLQRSGRACLMVLAGLCLLLARPSTGGAQSDKNDGPPPTLPVARRPAQLVCVFIGGMNSDPSPRQIAGTAKRREGSSGMYRLAREIGREGVEAVYFNWNGTEPGRINDSNPPLAGAIVSYLRDRLRTHPSDRIALVGNSWGGLTAWQAADELARSETPLAIDLLVLLDPSSTGRALQPPRERPLTVNASANYYTRNRFVWGAWPVALPHEDIDLGDPAQGFLREKGPNYANPLDFPAHVAAEWDDRIHLDIRNRLWRLIPQE
ncbi:MAG: hypothetical protein ACKOGA_09335 [Planctomycetaceae bacterium]